MTLSQHLYEPAWQRVSGTLKPDIVEYMAWTRIKQPVLQALNNRINYGGLLFKMDKSDACKAWYRTIEGVENSGQHAKTWIT